MLKVYGFSRVNSVARGNTRDLRVLWALEEMQMPFELIGMNHPAHELSTDAYRKLSPFEQIPAIDDDGIVLSESAAILVYLAKKARKLIPGDPAGEAQVVRWCFAAMNTIEFPLLAIMFLDWSSDHSAGANAQRKRFVEWAHRHLASLVLSGVNDDSLLKPYDRVRSYRERCKSRPAWRRTIEAYCARVEAA